MFDVIAIGSATVDVFMKSHSELIKIKTQHSEEKLIAYPSGSKVLIKDLQFMTGGGGTNTAVCFSKLGLKTAYLGNIGKDENGTRVINQLKKEKIKFIGTISNDLTNYSVILDSIEHDRTILAYKEASQKLKFSKINKSKLKAKWFYSSALMGNAFKTEEQLASYASKNKIKFALNPSSYQAKKGKKFLAKLLSNTNLLVLNREEAGLVLGIAKNTKIELLLKGLYNLGPEIVIITEGKKGAYCFDGKYKYYAKPKVAKVLETTGAGDAFASTFLTALIKKKDIEFALKVATVNAQSVTKQYGAKNGLLSWNKALSLMKSPKTRPSLKKTMMK
ncbi:carbohydrate kinase family protein [Candidatus Woesearchaeota archaeon]|jgi:ribokinase|nr:carbohydrate kinase family protein [Candidatus Woesearchaeota archaeon]MBT3538072.1 carbohydrate kinase family protein [Candidatus Woesearchaeota archaeon]MBT4697156.1 carbohydrate kinase family protein [Candidatus Woesearchaeota archaeon]MBT4717147.1 carbohydrate kinase family protein [Candidatus Woesearchaeota archaeon]MBT7105741.1 carbohydrate kinase family protein [Candidatus Woesearchaeota archaeon]